MSLFEDTAEYKEPEYVNGDTYDEDTNEFLGRLTEGVEEELKTIPAQISIFKDGFFYVYKMDSRASLEQIKEAAKEE